MNQQFRCTQFGGSIYQENILPYILAVAFYNLGILIRHTDPESAYNYVAPINLTT